MSYGTPRARLGLEVSVAQGPRPVPLQKVVEGERAVVGAVELVARAYEAGPRDQERPNKDVVFGLTTDPAPSSVVTRDIRVVQMCVVDTLQRLLNQFDGSQCIVSPRFLVELRLVVVDDTVAQILQCYERVMGLLID